jgi:hypothetical protein
MREKVSAWAAIAVCMMPGSRTPSNISRQFISDCWHNNFITNSSDCTSKLKNKTGKPCRAAAAALHKAKAVLPLPGSPASKSRPARQPPICWLKNSKAEGIIPPSP